MMRNNIEIDEQADFSLPMRLGEKIVPSDYSVKDNWCCLPEEENPFPVDIFVCYPSTFLPENRAEKCAKIGDRNMRKGAERFMENCASLFRGLGNIYAPFYRQLNANWALTLSESDMVAYSKGVPQTDVFAAFEYYIENYNNSKPFILFGHSQGADMLKNLLFERIADSDTCSRMIAAYIIGFFVTQEELDEKPRLKFADNPWESGVIISYNTVSEDFNGELAVTRKNALAVNPITWTCDEDYADRAKSRGSCFWIDGGLRRFDAFADAWVDKSYGVLRTKASDARLLKPLSKIEGVIPTGSFHSYDIPLFYYDLRENAKVRIRHAVKDAVFE